MTAKTKDDPDRDAFENCFHCKWAASPGPVFLGCTNKKSEFYGSLVMTDGWCPEHAATDEHR